jgi:SAM-dependent methyltransferase
MKNTSDFYQQQYLAYHDKTFSIDPTSFLEPLIRHLKPGESILDVGCGSGRDLKWLKGRGFDVTGFERCKGLAVLARENASCTVIEGDFEAYDFSTMQVDALVLCGALVHIPHERFEKVLKNIVRALKPDGKLLVSLKQGQGSSLDGDGREFYYWQAPELDAIFAKHGLSVLKVHTNISKVNQKDTWLSYVLRNPLRTD